MKAIIRSPTLWLFLVILMIAFSIDLLTDQSGGAVILAALPISLVALCTAILGQWRMKGLLSAEFRNWLVGGALILAVTLLFASQSSEAAKVGIDIFTYALIFLAPPASLVVAPMWIVTDLLPKHDMWLDILVVWIACICAGIFQWLLIAALITRFRHADKEKNERY